MKVHVQEAILVEGRYDKNTLSQVVDALILECGGFSVFRDPDRIAFLRQVAEKRGLIIFTDSDGAGFVIRNRLKSMLPPGHLLHAYIPDVPGREKRKKKSSKEGLLGVEGMTPAVILDALRRSGAHFSDGPEPVSPGTITRQDLYALGLMGGKDSSLRRDLVKKQLKLPVHLSTEAFLEVLNLMTDRAGLEQILHDI